MLALSEETGHIPEYMAANETRLCVLLSKKRKKRKNDVGRGGEYFLEKLKGSVRVNRIKTHCMHYESLWDLIEILYKKTNSVPT